MTETEGVKIEEIHDEDKKDSSDDEPPGLEEAPTGGEQAGQDKSTKQSRSEKKSRKAIQKLGMKPVSGIIRVTVKKAKGVCNCVAVCSVFSCGLKESS
jgi:nascent polypeptide-associated complex subunit alpha